MFGYIILRDIPKSNAQLDLSIFEIKGGFRGFAEVPPGLHYVSVEHGDKMVEGFWCYIKPDGVVIKIYDYSNELFNDDEPENVERYTQMALSGAMNRALIPVMQRNPKMETEWLKLTLHISEEDFPLKLNKEVPMEPPVDLSPEEMSSYFVKEHKSRFEQAFQDTHKSNQDRFLAELELAYVRFIIKNSDEEAFNRWAYLLQAIYHAGERCIEPEPELFISIVEVLMRQFKFVPKDFLTSDSKVVFNISHLIEDMADTGVKSLVEKSKEFATYLESKGVSI